MYQEITIAGNLGRDPELRYLPSGQSVCDFSVAVTERWHNRKTDIQEEKTTWMRVTAWGRLAEICNEHLSKGRQVLVVGTIDASAWTDANNNARATLELTARTVKFLGRKDDAPDWGDAADQPQGQGARDGDIPF